MESKHRLGDVGKFGENITVCIFEASNETIKILESPQYVNDISFWFDEKNFNLDIFKETVMKISENSVIDIRLIDEYFCKTSLWTRYIDE